MMNLNIFPTLVSKFDIKKLVERIENKSKILRASTSCQKEETADEDKRYILFNEFEEILKQIAIKSFQKNSAISINEAINKLILHIKDHAKVIYLTRLSTEAKSNNYVNIIHDSMSRTQNLTNLVKASHNKLFRTFNDASFLKTQVISNINCENEETLSSSQEYK